VTTLYCKDTPGLHVGPGRPGSPNVVDFLNGYADVDEDNDPLASEKMAWIRLAAPAYGIRILEVDEVPVTDPNAPKCPACGLAFATERKLNGHILGAHRGKKE
jgi:hypothetical protein